jgi:TDG/mug DNA glycosylase family protein
MATETSLPDILGPGLELVFCGLNPGMAAAAAGHHFLGRGNRFWNVLHQAGFTPHQLAPQEDRSVLDYDIGLTTMVGRPTARATQVMRDEYANAVPALLQKLDFYQPRCIAFLGKPAYQAMTEQPQIAWGEQPPLGAVQVWVLPNPSGLNRNFSTAQLVEAYAALKLALSAPRRR